MAGSSRNGQHLKAYEYFLCGSATGFIVAFVEGPIDLVSVVMCKCTVSEYFRENINIIKNLLIGMTDIIYSHAPLLFSQGFRQDQIIACFGGHMDVNC